jgi:site-specific recombinase XerD
MPRHSEICDLEDGSRVRYSLKRRANRPWYYVCFRGPDDNRKERSTCENSRRRAQESANTIIRQVYFQPSQVNLDWDEAVELMLRHMEAENLRPGTIQQYKLAIGALREVFPESHGPSDITPQTAEQFKVERVEAGLAPRTVAGNIQNLSIVYGCWFRSHCGILEANPFENVTPPREDQTPPRIVEPDEQQGLLDWLEERWPGWRLPLLLLDVKAGIGCRIGELASATTASLRDGRLCFTSETTKGRKQRACMLPPDVFEELQAMAGETYVFEAFSEQLRAIHKERSNFHYAQCVKDFSPTRLKNWIQVQARLYFQETGAEKFKLHNFRGTAMSRARMAGVTEDDAAIAFGCSSQTMREHYLAIDEELIADNVFGAIQ